MALQGAFRRRKKDLRAQSPPFGIFGRDGLVSVCLSLISLHLLTFAHPDSDCWRISDLPLSDVEELIAICKELHYSTLLQTLATPDSLEAAGAIAATYEQVHKLAVDGWTVFEPFLRKVSCASVR